MSILKRKKKEVEPVEAKPQDTFEYKEEYTGTYYPEKAVHFKWLTLKKSTGKPLYILFEVHNPVYEIYHLGGVHGLTEDELDFLFNSRRRFLAAVETHQKYWGSFRVGR